MKTPKAQREIVQKIYNQDSNFYVTSSFHSASSSLTRCVEILDPKGGILLDIATGGGHVAIKMAKHCHKVIASDLTKGMIEATRENASVQKIQNIHFLRTDSEMISVSDSSLDYVSVRIAPHHFSKIRKFIEEAYRTLKPGGKFIFVDNICPEEDTEAKAYNFFEKKRDPSHNECLSVSKLNEIFINSGFKVLHTEIIRKKMDFPEWVNRPNINETTVVELEKLLSDSSPILNKWLNLREEEGKLFFDEIEGIFLLQKPAR
ncbi:MAG: class I SAM-dependent methyltransferase [Nitrospinota bacterium]|nr:class I SAM-dependent methyltransferase [Nitrospinota bacterium]